MRPSPDIYRARRRRLSEGVGGLPIVLFGHRPVARNFVANVYPFRQDSSFLYFTGVNQPGAAVTIDDGGRSTLYLPATGPDDALWHGEVPSPERIAAAAGVDDVRPNADFAATGFLSLPLASPSTPAPPASDELVRAVVALRLALDETEVAAIRRALAVTGEAHLTAMAATRAGVTDIELRALVDGIFALRGMTPAYASIVTARGEVLHGSPSGAALNAGELLLLDAGAEEPGGYASDVTRTWPVDGRFTPRQRDVYQAVLEANRVAIAMAAPGVAYRDLHLLAARVIARFGVDAGLLRGDVDGLVERGAHAVFFPHGLGHLLGLDVHDMELYGDLAGYDPVAERSEQFGLSFLRLDRELQPGMVVTIEPGFYVVPAILADRSLRDRFGDSVCWSEAETWLPFGGVRIEDDVLLTPDGCEVLSADIPKDVAALEARVGAGASPSARLLGPG